MTSARNFLKQLNKEYLALHKAYEEVFWESYMGDHSYDTKKDKAMIALTAFRTNTDYATTVNSLLKKSSGETKKRLLAWKKFFDAYQSPIKAVSIKEAINKLETKIHKHKVSRKEGYTDPRTKKFVSASINKMTMMIATEPDMRIRKACFDATQKLAVDCIDDYITLIGLRNDYARTLGYLDFYDFKVRREDGMTKKELFSIFETIYEKTKYSFADIRKLEKKIPGLRKPWNFAYLLSGNFTQEEDQYFQFEDALMKWGRSFAALGIDFKRGKLKLDLLNRKGKYSNGFCHWPVPVHFESGKRIAGIAQFTCNAVVGQVGSGMDSMRTLFHEGGHAAHFLNNTERDIIMNQEYAPCSTSWAETQSMFLDTIFSSIEWRTRYASDKSGATYPFDLFERKVRALHLLSPRDLNGIISVAVFEKEIYETKNLTREKILHIARKNYKKYNDLSVDSLQLLNVPHIYSWESSGAYHGYGLAQLALYQWRDYFFKKYGYIVDNPHIGKEMERVWKLGAAKTFNQFVKLATGKKLSANAFLKKVTQSLDSRLRDARAKIKKLESVPISKKSVQLHAHISMTHGKKEIANNKKSFEDMARTYALWLRKQKRGE